MLAADPLSLEKSEGQSRLPQPSNKNKDQVLQLEHEDGSTRTVPKTYKASMALLVQHATQMAAKRPGGVPRINRQCGIGKAAL